MFFFAVGPALKKLVFYFLSNWMGYDRGDSFPLEFEPNGNPFDSNSKGKLSPRSYSNQLETKLKSISASVTLKVGNNKILI